jgi:uncharacterized protein (DUF58 family)
MISERLGLDATLLATLERYTLHTRRRMRGQGPGPRRSLALGSSVDFADYRTYSEGDDLRRIDWSAYARLERLFLKVFEAEQNARVTLVVDCSASMAGGEPSKSLEARRICAALAYIALASYDSVAVMGVADRAGPYLPPRRGRERVAEVWQFLSDLPEAGETALDRLADVGRLVGGPGISVVVSDFLTETDWQRGLQRLQRGARQDMVVVQMLSPQDLAPDLTGDLVLVDAETGQNVEVSVNQAVLRRYRALLEAYIAELQHWCRSQGMQFVQLSSATPLTQVLAAILRQHGGQP